MKTPRSAIHRHSVGFGCHKAQHVDQAHASHQCPGVRLAFDNRPERVVNRPGAVQKVRGTSGETAEATSHCALPLPDDAGRDLIVLGDFAGDLAFQRG